VFQIARRLTGIIEAGVAAAVLVAVIAFGYGQETLTEHLAMAFLMSGLWLGLSKSDRFWGLAGMGALVSLAVLTRSNLIYVAFVLGLYLALASVRPKGHVHRLGVLAYTAGGLVPVTVVVALYALAGGLAELYVSVIAVPLHYSSHQRGPMLVFLDTIYNVRHNWLVSAPILVGSYLAWVGLGIVALAAALSLSSKSTSIPREQNETMIAVAGAASAYSVLASGVCYPHYWCQIYPFAALAGAYGAAQTWVWLRHAQNAAALVIVVGSLVTLAPSAIHVLTHRAEVERGYFIRRAAEAIAADRAPGDRIWAVTNHLVLWYLDEPPISRAAAQPDNIVRAVIIEPLARAGLAPLDSFDRAMASKPRYIVTDRSGAAYYLEGGALARFRGFLAENYALWHEARNVRVYKRSTPSP
jgi:hypothetical protein